MSTNVKSLTRGQIQQQLGINAKLITFYISEMLKERGNAKAMRSMDVQVALCSDRYARTYKLYIKRLTLLQLSLKWELRYGRKGLSASEAAGRWPVPSTRQVH